MFANSSTLAFFPTFVWVHDLKPEDSRAINEVIIGKIEEVIPAPGSMTLRHSLQSETNLHRLPEFASLMNFAMEAATRTLDFLEYERSAMRVTGCWANISPPGAYHYEHSHPNNFLSGVYYPKIPRGGDSINFLDPRPQAHVIAPRVKKLSTKHASTVNVTLKTGRMVLFPSWLRHSVDINAGTEYRLSVAFNIMLDSFAEQVSKPRFEGAVALKKSGRAF